MKQDRLKAKNLLCNLCHSLLLEPVICTARKCDWRICGMCYTRMAVKVCGKCLCKTELNEKSEQVLHELSELKVRCPVCDFEGMYNMFIDHLQDCAKALIIKLKKEDKDLLLADYKHKIDESVSRENKLRKEVGELRKQLDENNKSVKNLEIKVQEMMVLQENERRGLKDKIKSLETNKKYKFTDNELDIGIRKKRKVKKGKFRGFEYIYENLYKKESMLMHENLEIFGQLPDIIKSAKFQEIGLRLDFSKKFLEMSIETKEEIAAHYRKLGNQNYQAKRWIEALNSYYKSLQFIENEKILYNIGQVYFKLDMLNSAHNAYYMSSQISKTNSSLHYRMYQIMKYFDLYSYALSYYIDFVTMEKRNKELEVVKEIEFLETQSKIQHAYYEQYQYDQIIQILLACGIYYQKKYIVKPRQWKITGLDNKSEYKQIVYQSDEIDMAFNGRVWQNNPYQKGTLEVNFKKEDLKISFVGNFVHGVIHGKGEISAEHLGKLTHYSGYFKNNKIAGTGILMIYNKKGKKIYSAKGNFVTSPKNEKLAYVHGYAEIYSDNKTYHGNMVEGVFQGHCWVVDNNNYSITSGFYKNGLICSGTVEYSDGSFYIGHLKEELADGLGEGCYKDKYYIGLWKKGRQCYSVTFINNKVLEGIFMSQEEFFSHRTQIYEHIYQYYSNISAYDAKLMETEIFKKFQLIDFIEFAAEEFQDVRSSARALAKSYNLKYEESITSYLKYLKYVYLSELIDNLKQNRYEYDHLSVIHKKVRYVLYVYISYIRFVVKDPEDFVSSEYGYLNNIGDKYDQICKHILNYGTAEKIVRVQEVKEVKEVKEDEAKQIKTSSEVEPKTENYNALGQEEGRNESTVQNSSLDTQNSNGSQVANCLSQSGLDTVNSNDIDLLECSDTEKSDIDKNNNSSKTDKTDENEEVDN